MSDIVNNPLTSQVILVALSDLCYPDWNPRPVVDADELQSLMDFMVAGGHVPPIFIWKGLQDQAPWDVISGKRRCEAARRLGKTQVEAIKLDITLEEAMFLAIASNKDSKPFWLHEYMAVEKLKMKNAQLNQVKIIAKTGWSDARVSQAMSLIALLNPASRDLIFQLADQKVSPTNFSEGKPRPNSAKKKKWFLTEKVAIRLIPLLDDDALEASQSQAEKAVQIIAKYRLTNQQTKELVAYALTGQDLTQYEPAAKVRKARSMAGTSKEPHSPLPIELADKVVELSPKTTPHIEAPSPKNMGTSIPSGSQPASHPPKFEDSPQSEETQHAPEKMGTSSSLGTGTTKAHASTGGLSVGATSSSLGTSTTKAHASTGGLSVGETLFWDSLVGISVISQIKAKVKKGERPSVSEVFLLAGHHIGRALAWMAKHGYKLIGHILKFIGKLLKGAVKESAKLLGKKISGAVQLVVTIVFICALAWMVWDGYHYGSFHPFKVIVSKLHLFSRPAPEVTETSSVPQTQPTVVKLAPTKEAVSTAPASKRSPQVTGISSAPVMASDVAQTQQELAGIPLNSVIKPYSFQPNFNMGSDMAYHRLMDLQLPEKYSMRWGADKEKVIAIISGASNITLTMQSDLVGAFLGGSTQVNIYWEDIKAIYTNVIESPTISAIKDRPGISNAKIIYQISLNLADSKKPLTIQCTNPADLEHLVSALEFYIKLSRGNTAPIGGLPYLNQGLRLDNNNKVTTLWADSPMDKAGVALGEILWSLEKYTDQQQSKTEMEAGLQSLTPGSHILFKVTAEGWKRALANTIPDQPETFHPLRRKVSLWIE